MNTHPYLRAYMAGIAVPTLALLAIMTAFTIARHVYDVPLPMERVIVFPMAIVPNLFGLWNILYVAMGSGRRLPIGFHGATLPFVLAPIGLTMATSLGFLTLGQDALVWFEVLSIPYSILVAIFLVTLIIYYLVWKYLVAFLNGQLGIA